MGERALLRGAGRDPDGGPSEVDAVLRDAEAGDVALGALKEVGRWLGIGLAGLVNVFDPQVVVLGGLFGRMAPLMHEPFASSLTQRALVTARAGRVVAASLGPMRRSWAPPSELRAPARSASRIAPTAFGPLPEGAAMKPETTTSEPTPQPPRKRRS